MSRPELPDSQGRQAVGRDWAESDAISFDTFTLFPRERRLEKLGERVAIGGRAFDLLTLLVERAPGVVSKDELFERAWPGLAVEDVSLRFQVNALRSALGAASSGGGFISTVQGRGYCFTSPVQRARPASRTNLRPSLHGIIGRDRELAELGEALSRYRLVTVLGSGGVGKTRLAKELGRRVLPQFPDGVWLVDLAPLSDPTLIASATASVLNLSFGAAEPTAHVVAQRISSRAMLLILDNCEHLVDAVADFASSLMSEAENLTVLATSQESLRVAGEQIYRLPPLALPPAGAGDAANYGAVALFVEVASRADPSFTLSPGFIERAAAVCRQLDGIPLALEMAAARLPLLGLDGLLARLPQRLSLLRHDERRADGRHNSLRQLADWSFSLLEDVEQSVFCHLAIFPGSFALESAVALTEPLGLDPAWGPLDALWRLREKSLVVVEPGAAPRYRLLETLRLYGLEQLGRRGKVESTAALHADHMADVFGRADAAWATTPDADWLARYFPEIGNLRAALDWSLAAPERRPYALRLATPTLQAFRQFSLIAEGRRYASRLVGLIGPDTPAQIEAGILLERAGLWRAMLVPEIQQDVERAVTLFRNLGDPVGLGKALNALGIIHWRQLRYDLAEANFAEALPLSSGKQRVSVMINQNLESLRAWNPGEERASLKLAAAMARDLGSSIQLISCLINSSVHEYARGNLDVAIGEAREAVSVARSTVEGGRLVTALDILCTYLVMSGRPQAARPVAEEAFARLGDMERSPIGFLETCAMLAALEGRLSVAARILGFVDAARARDGPAREPSEQILCDELARRLEAGLSAGERAVLEAGGASWSEAEAIRCTGEALFGAVARGQGGPAGPT